RRTGLPLPQAGSRLDGHPAAFAADRRSLELVAGDRAVGIVVGPRGGRRAASALGARLGGGRAEPGAGAAGRWRTVAALGHAGTPPATPRKVARTPPGAGA